MAKDLFGDNVKTYREEKPIDKYLVYFKSAWIFEKPLEKIILGLVIAWAMYSIAKFLFSL